MKRLLLLLALCLPAFAARTTVTGLLTRADGSTCSGSLAVSWYSFTSVTGQLIYAGNLQYAITAGVISISLEPGNYTVSYVVAPSGCTPTTEYWTVPVSATPVTLDDVRVLNLPPPTPSSIPLSAISQSGAATGQFPQWTGMAWVPVTAGPGSGTVLNSGTLTNNQLMGGAGGVTIKAVNLTGDATTSGGLATTLATVNSAVGTCGDSTHVSQVTLDAKGRATNCVPVSIAASSGTVTVVGAGSLTSTAIMTGGGAQTAQTPCATCTLDSSGNFSTPGTITTDAGGTDPGIIIFNPTTVASLPTCNSAEKGARAFVTNATATTFLSVVAGGGSNNVPVVCNGTNWLIG